MVLCSFKIHIHFLRPFGCINDCTVLIAIHFKSVKERTIEIAELQFDWNCNSRFSIIQIEKEILRSVWNYLIQSLVSLLWLFHQTFSSKIFCYFLKMAFRRIYLILNFIKVFTANFNLISVLRLLALKKWMSIYENCIIQGIIHFN